MAGIVSFRFPVSARPCADGAARKDIVAALCEELLQKYMDEMLETMSDFFAECSRMKLNHYPQTRIASLLRYCFEISEAVATDV
ncbi:MAG: hypothetical protein FWB79_06220 [Treponema sp.]|nr:hypothetical protein [Treponema sp.]